MRNFDGVAKTLGVTVLTAGLVASVCGGASAYAEEIGGTVTTGAAVTVIPQPAPLGTSTMIKANKAASLKQVTLTWTQTGEAQGYVVMRKSGKDTYTEVARVSDGNPGTKTYVDLAVKPGAAYTYQVLLWRIRSDGTEERGTCSNSVSVSLVPGKVKGLKAKKGRGKITITWKKTKNITGYQVYTKVFVKGIKMKYSKAKTLKSRKYKRGMLVKGMKYGFKVRAYKKVKGKNIYGPFTTVTKRY